MHFDSARAQENATLKLHAVFGRAGVWLAALMLAGCADPPAATSTTTTSAAPTTTAAAAPSGEPRTKKWVDLQIGDCLADPPPTGPSVVTVTVVDCAAAHAAEVYLRVAVDVDAALDDVANRDCGAGLAQYTPGGGPYAMTYLIDSEQDRTSNNPMPSTVICVLQDANGGSMSGSARR